MNRTWLVLDCDYMCHRAKHAMGSELSYAGKATGVTYGFLRDVLKLMSEFNTKFIVFCFDHGSNKFRERMYKEYKQNRRHKDLTEAELEFEKDFHRQRLLLKEKYLFQIGFKNVYYKAGYESDDIIASVCKTIRAMDDYSIIVSSDQDLYQLLNHKTSMYNPHKRMTMTVQNFVNTYGIPAHKWSLVKAVAGCSTDNVKGVTGVGEKTAIKFLQKELKKDSKAFQNIMAGKRDGLIDRNLKLVRLPFKNTPKYKLKKDKLSKREWMKLIDQLGFSSLRDRFPIPKGLVK